MLQGVLVDEAIEVLFQRAGHFGRTTRAGAVDKARGAFMCKAIDPLAQRGIGKVQGVRDSLEAVALNDLAHGLSTAEHTGLLSLFKKGLQGGEGLLGKVEFEGPHRGGLQNKILQKYQHYT
jgi:hypothetical protein